MIIHNKISKHYPSEELAKRTLHHYHSCSSGYLKLLCLPIKSDFPSWSIKEQAGPDSSAQPAHLNGLGASYISAGVATNTSPVHQLARLVNNDLQHTLCFDLVNMESEEIARDSGINPFGELYTSKRFCGLLNISDIEVTQSGKSLKWRCPFQIPLPVNTGKLRFVSFLMIVVLLLTLSNFIKWVFARVS